MGFFARIENIENEIIIWCFVECYYYLFVRSWS